MQSALEVMDLALCKPRGIASRSLVIKPCYTFSAVLSAPLHEGDSAAPSDSYDLLRGVASAIQSDRLVASAGGAVFAAAVAIGEFPDLVFR